MCVNNLPRVALDSGEARTLNLRPTDRKFSVLATQPPSHTSQWGNRKFDRSALAMPKRRNRSSPKVAYVITSRTSTNMENLVTIPQRVYFPRYARNCASKMSTDFFFGGDTNGPQPRSLNRFSCKTCQMTWFRTRICLFGIRKQKFNIQKPPFWG